MQFKRLKYDTNWNIGFCDQSKEDFIREKKIGKVRWLQHPYKDRWFADPFILSYNKEQINVLVEECPIDNPKGIICELVIDRRSMLLKERYVLLELDTHLSYPAIWREGGNTYVYPENGASGSLKIYEYDKVSHKLVNPKVILKEAVADSTIWKSGEKCFLCATKFPDTQQNVYLYSSKTVFGPFVQEREAPFATDKTMSRPAGNLLEVEGELYRPAQNCGARYGAGITVLKSSLSDEKVIEDRYIDLRPCNWRYNLGIHTVNFCDDFCVVDGSGYLYPYSGVIIEFLRKIKRAVAQR